MLLRTEGYPMLVSVIETAKTVGKNADIQDVVDGALSERMGSECCKN